MTDRELLELAAKAAGYQGVVRTSAGEGEVWLYCDQPVGIWSPLHNDGDALRLAVKLEMLVDPLNRVVGGYLSDINIEISQEELDKNPYAATRRAIVMVAAEIGKEMS